MRWSQVALALAAFTFGASASDVRSGDTALASEQTGESFAPDRIRVMTYNVKGLPWPAASGRPEPLAKIGAEIRALRSSGRQPHILLLQEAFTADAKAIGRAAGYRYLAFGPAADSPEAIGRSTVDRDLSAAASAWHGEGLGRWVDGGLAIFSDFPIVEVAAWVFPADACAGFDCLAAKGLMIAKVRIPGAPEPLSIINTHLNSDATSTGVSAARSDASFAWQYGTLNHLLSSKIPGDAAVIFGGDVNIGPSKRRRSLAAELGSPLAGAAEAFGRAVDSGLVPAADLDAVLAIRAKRVDQVYHRSGATTRLSLEDVRVPFKTGEATSFSDHAAVMATYRLSPRPSDEAQVLLSGARERGRWRREGGGKLKVA